MSSYFESIRNYFKGKYHGRYFSILLRELAQHEPESFCLLIDQIAKTSRLQFWKDLSKDLREGISTVECERRFKGRSLRRRADLAIVRGDANVVLMEVKEFDRLNSENKQLDDYLRAASDEVGFIYVYRFLPDDTDSRKIKKKTADGFPVAMLSYNQIYDALKDSKDHNRALGALICDYLQEIGVGIYRAIGKSDRKALSFLMAQMLGFPHKTGMGRLQGDATVRRAPQLLATLLSNLEVIGEWARQPNEGIVPQHSNTRFWIQPWFDHQRLKKKIAKSSHKTEILPNGISDYVEGGGLFIETTATLRDVRLKKDDRLQLTLGIGIELEKGAQSSRFYAYTQFSNGKNFSSEDTFAESEYSSSLPNEQHMYSVFRSILSESKREAIRLSSGPGNTLLKKFEIPRGH